MEPSEPACCTWALTRMPTGVEMATGMEACMIMYVFMNVQTDISSCTYGYVMALDVMMACL